MRGSAPAPSSTTTSMPERPSRPTTSGTMATRYSPEAVSLGTPSFIESAQRNGIDWSVGVLSLLHLPVQLGTDAERPKNRIGLFQVACVADGEREPGRRAHCRRHQEEERDGGEWREQDGPTAVADRRLAAHAAEGG